ncbi:MAG: peptidase S41 [Planctomycetales bacterium 12-60-4]|nr:MAG: peptidase S41 [Planctomycetales bacterium 12-60-4]
MGHWRRGICGLACAMLICTLVAPAGAAEEDDYYELMKLFVDTFEQIDRNYVKEVPRRELVEAAMRGMIARLDPYSSYIDQEDLSQFNTVVEQEFGGVGIQVNVNDKTRELMVMTPLPGTPAYEAGLRPGDKILEIDGKATASFGEGREMDTAIKMMRGKPGEKVTLSILHAGAQKPETVEITRAIIKTPTALGDRYRTDGTWEYLFEGGPKIGYIRLTHFSRNSADEMEQSLIQLQKEGMQALVLDLRYNPGGLLQAATAICDMFIDSGVIVSTKGRNTEEQVFKAKKPGTFSGFPMVVLVNRYSASASEIVSACLQDHKRAVIVGERTWGKGSVQNVIELEGGASALKLTTASYHRPSGKNIHRFPDYKESDVWGVSPDDGYEVKWNLEDAENYRDYRAERDVLRPTGEIPKSEYVDSQMAKGLEYLHAELGKSKDDSEKKPADAKEDKKDEKKKEEQAVPDKDAAAISWPIRTLLSYLRMAAV